ncbi:MAG TPA: glycoside hydrolase family 3 N-terminal domain-containing protein [Steroidobacteraceae bacterium]|jgi:beta-glucosidase|nr:glycoside hydrolase family 3 N-terminal domain-containing protein [Steroidobacteraceae bacterium]
MRTLKPQDVQRIETLIERMSLTEKLGQLTMMAASHTVTGPVIAGHSTDDIRSGRIGNLLNLIGAGAAREMQRLAVEESRLGIPLLIGLDVIHGHRTLFPTPLAEVALFDPETWTLTAREAAREAAADGINIAFAPMLDVSRDPRWGRIVEGPGESPWVGRRLAEAKVGGFQGADLAAADSLAAVAKHFCGYGAVTAGREYASVDVSDRTLLEVYMPPFAAAVSSGVAAVMPAFMDLAGIPMTAHTGMLRARLRRELGFEGVLISDYNAIAELIQHGVAADLIEAAALALEAGVDIDMVSGAYLQGLPVALERGLVSAARIDESVHRVLTLKARLGLFEDPYARGAAAESAAVIAQRRRLARDVGARSMVLLSNRDAALPLSGAIQRLALIGPLADAPAEMRGPWWCAAQPDAQVSVLEGMRAALPGTQILHASGVDIGGSDESGIAAALERCDGADAVLLCLGEAATMSGEAASRAHPGLPGRQRQLAEAVLGRAGARAIPVIAVLFCGRPLVVPWLAERASALLAAWFPGCEAGHALADIVTGHLSPSGRTPISWPRAVGQIPLHFGQRSSGRPADPTGPFASRYIDESNEPLFPFGHGLTYGRFALANLRLSPQSAAAADTVEVRVDVENGGARRAEETVFLFARRLKSRIAPPVLELHGVGKITLDPGARDTLTLHLPIAQLRALGPDLEPLLEPGTVEVLVGPSAHRGSLLAGRLEVRI